MGRFQDISRKPKSSETTEEKETKQNQQKEHPQSIDTVNQKGFFKPWKEISPELYSKSSQLQS